MTTLGMADYDLTKIKDGSVLSGPMGDCCFVAGLATGVFWAQHCPGGLSGLDDDFYNVVPTRAHVYVVPGLVADTFGHVTWDSTFKTLKSTYRNLMVFGKAPFAKLEQDGKLTRMDESKKPLEARQDSKQKTCPLFYNSSDHALWIPDHYSGGEILIFDIRGRPIHKARVDGDHLTLPGLIDGLYFVQVKNGSQACTTRILIH